jgi:hypothetical protein
MHKQRTFLFSVTLAAAAGMTPTWGQVVLPSAGPAGSGKQSTASVPDIPNAEHGFTMIFSAVPFPGHQFRLESCRGGDSGNWYYAPQLELEGWLCPALLRYFDEALKELYVRVRSAPQRGSHK